MPRDERLRHAAERARASRNGEQSGQAADEYPPEMRGDAWEGDHLAGDLPETGPPTKVEDWPDLLAPEAFYGLAGELVRAIEPESEADPGALLIQALVAFGNVIGRTCHFRVEGDRHYLNLFAVLVGETSKARKGTSWGRVRWPFSQVDPEWADRRIMGGLSSGEGLVWSVRDPISGREKVKERGRVTAVQEYEADPGEADKRLLVYEPEFASVLRQIERQGNTLSAIIRQAWENGCLRTLTKNSPAKSTGAHVSIIGHITAEELRKYLSTTEAASGFGNRFLWLCVRRSKCLPEGGQLVDLQPYAERLKEAVQFCANMGEPLYRDDHARQLWSEVYPALSEGTPGLAGALTARAEAQTMRVACLFALLDCSALVGAAHLLAALALWDFCERSVRFIFGESLGDDVADEILGALRQSPLTRHEIRNLLGRHQTAPRIARALGLLERFGLAECRHEQTGGRPTERWFYSHGAAPKAP
jgi:hypothetical protein